MVGKIRIISTIITASAIIGAAVLLILICIKINGLGTLIAVAGIIACMLAVSDVLTETIKDET